MTLKSLNSFWSSLVPHPVSSAPKQPSLLSLQRGAPRGVSKNSARLLPQESLWSHSRKMSRKQPLTETGRKVGRFAPWLSPELRKLPFLRTLSPVGLTHSICWRQGPQCHGRAGREPPNPGPACDGWLPPPHSPWLTSCECWRLGNSPTHFLPRHTSVTKERKLPSLLRSVTQSSRLEDVGLWSELLHAPAPGFCLLASLSPGHLKSGQFPEIPLPCS